MGKKEKFLMLVQTWILVNEIGIRPGSDDHPYDKARFAIRTLEDAMLIPEENIPDYIGIACEEYCWWKADREAPAKKPSWLPEKLR